MKREFVRVTFINPKGKKQTSFFEKTIRGYHPVQLHSDETVTIKLDKVIKSEPVEEIILYD